MKMSNKKKLLKHQSEIIFYKFKIKGYNKYLILKIKLNFITLILKYNSIIFFIHILKLCLKRFFITSTNY